MAHSVATDKTLGRACWDINKLTADAVLSAKNVTVQEHISWGGQTPSTHMMYHFLGTTVPDNTDYPDTLAPIGSQFKRLVITSGAVAGSQMYLKTAAATWTALT